MPFLYGKADEKFVKTETCTQNLKLKPLDTYKFHLNTQLDGNQKVKLREARICLKISPDKLVEICSPILDAIPLPLPFHWNIHEVADWIRKLGFPQYQNTFKKNQINGRTLLRLDISYLVKMNIKDFSHLRTISTAIRNLYGFEKSAYNRSISFPCRDLDSLYKFLKTKTGPKYEKIRRTDVGRLHNLIRPRPLYETHWQSLELWLKHTDLKEPERFGGNIWHKNDMFIPRKGGPTSVGQQKIYRDCTGIPPCMCNWTQQKDFREPWELKCLAPRNKMDLKYKCFEKCSIYECQKGLSLLKEYIPHKYASHNDRGSISRNGRIRSSEI